MNAPDFQADVDPGIGLYERAAGETTEWWRVTRSARPHLYRIEHGRGTASPDIDTEVDAENLKAKRQKWQREGFVDTREADAPAATHPEFLAELRRVRTGGADLAAAASLSASATAATAASPGATHGDAGIRIGATRFASGAPHPLVPALNPAYLFTSRVDDVAADIAENRRVMLIGHTGSGKTSLIEQIAARIRRGVLRANMNGQTTIGDFVGFWTVKGGETIWIDGVLPTAMREGLWLIVDEIDFAEPSILAALTAVLEKNGRLLLKEKGNEIIEPHADFRLFATANAIGAMSRFRYLYQGANLMNEAFLDRWRVYLLDYLSPAEEAEVLMRTLPALTPTLAETLAAIAADCRAAFLREDLASAFSTRRLIDWAELMLRTGDPERAAGPVIYAKVDPDDAALIRSIVRHHIDLDA